MSDNLTVLVVEDDPISQEMTRHALASAGHTVLTANDAFAALDLLGAHRPDVIVTDWNMPGMNGIEFVAKLRTLAAYAKTPVLMMTTMAEKENILEAMKTGVTNYVVKPFDARTLKKKIEQILDG